MFEAWLNTAEAALIASLRTQTTEAASQTLSLQARQERENLLGEVLAFRAYLWGYQEENGQAVLSLCQQALSLFSVKNSLLRAHIGFVQLQAYYFSSINNAVAGIECGRQGGSLALATGQVALAISLMGSTAAAMIGTGQLHEAQRLSQQAIQLGRQSGGLLKRESLV